ncbi:hypothetical protein BTJ68_10413 [Hortaea werneckii EXF-2000]|uniref:AP-1 complex subunit sigma-1 n=2 Tax=Hortaea werneckii TaxID=91943 RepID=A0A1Z5T3V2_HORWE|nr:hypothetical protein BTJ68_10413 [Hortaea werneckii EXF-2000]
MAIRYMILLSRQGKVRLAKWFTTLSPKDKAKIIKDVSQLVLARRTRMCNFIEYKDTKIVYRRYASLFFIAATDPTDNELLTLEIVHRYVEQMDKYYGNVCELDIIFNFQKAYFILDELLLAGELQESSKKNVLRVIGAQDGLEEMEYLPLPDFDVATNALNFSTPDCHIIGGCDLYTTKAAGKDKKLYKDIENSLESQYESLVRLSASLSPPCRALESDDGRTNEQGGRRKKRSLTMDPPEIDLSRASPFGPLSQITARRTFAYLIATLNASHPDYDFSHTLRPTDFRREPSLRRIMHNVDSTLQNLRPRPTTLYLAPPTLSNSMPVANSFGNEVWSPRMWSLIDKEMGLRQCDKYAYVPDEDPFDGDEGSIWSMHYFFFNKQRKRVCYLYLRGLSVISHSPVHAPTLLSRPLVERKASEVTVGEGAGKRASYWFDGNRAILHDDIDTTGYGDDDDDEMIIEEPDDDEVEVPDVDLDEIRSDLADGYYGYDAEDDGFDDFAGYLVKANSEGQPGPLTYNRTLAQGANLFAERLKSHGGIVMFRAFVYDNTINETNWYNDRANAAVDFFKPLDGQFDENVIVQIKYGPIDFQVREPASPLFVNIPNTNTAIELQITQEYLGQQCHLLYWAPLWKLILDTDLRADHQTSYVKDIMSMESWPAYENYSGNLGIQTLNDILYTHYGPNPQTLDGNGWGQWTRADGFSIGMDRTVSNGTGFAGQYPEEVAQMYEDIATTPDNYLLWFHHVNYTHILKSGATVIQDFYDQHYAGAQTAQTFVPAWKSLEGKIDNERYTDQLFRQVYQAGHSIVWRDAIANYYHNLSGIPDKAGRVGHYPSRIEAENMILDGYEPYAVSPFEVASNYTAIVTTSNMTAGTASTILDFDSGTYDIAVNYYDMYGGASHYSLMINNDTLGEWTADAKPYIANQAAPRILGHTPSIYVDGHSAIRITFSNVTLNKGDMLKIIGTPDGNEPAPLDYVSVLQPGKID